MHRRSAAVLLSGALITGVAGAAVAPVAPVSAADSSPHRWSAFADALRGLVTDGTLTQAQADKVVQTLADAAPQRGAGHGGRGPGLAKAAEVLGLSTDELRTQLRGGQALAQVAGTEGVAVADLVDALITEEKERLAQAVTDGTITQAQADARTARVSERVIDRVTGVRPERGPGGPGSWKRHNPGPG